MARTTRSFRPTLTKTDPLEKRDTPTSGWLTSLLGPQLAAAVSPLAGFGVNPYNLQSTSLSNQYALTNYYRQIPSYSFGYNPYAAFGAMGARLNASSAIYNLFRY